MFFLPGLGLMAMAGPITSAWVRGFDGPELVEDVSMLAASFCRMGLPKNEAMACESALKADKYLLTVHGSAKEAERARTILASVKEWEGA